MTRTITLSDGRVVGCDVRRGRLMGWLWFAGADDDRVVATGPTEADAIAALKQKLENGNG